MEKTWSKIQRRKPSKQMKTFQELLKEIEMEKETKTSDLDFCEIETGQSDLSSKKKEKRK